MVEEEPEASASTVDIGQLINEQFAGGRFHQTILTCGAEWSMTWQEGFFGETRQKSVGVVEQRALQNDCMDFLELIAGDLVFEMASLHVIHTGAHVYEQSIVDFVIEQNENPIETLEKDLEKFAAILK